MALLRILPAILTFQTGANEELPFSEDWFLSMIVISAVVYLIIAIVVGYWVYKDAAKRENREIVWATITGGSLLLFLPLGIVSVVLYFVFRGDETVFEPERGTSIEEDGKRTL